MITSSANQKVKRIVQLSKKAGERKKEAVFIAEGIKMFLEVPETELCEVYVSESFLKCIYEKELSPIYKDAVEKLKKCEYETVADEIFARMSDMQTPQGILCVTKQKQYSLDKLLKETEAPLFLLLENIQDPGNLGTIIRTGEGAGVSAIVLSNDSVDIYNPKSIRATMGSVYRIPFVYTENLLRDIEHLKERGLAVYAAHLRGEKYYDTYDYKKGTAFLIGNEANGLKEETAQAADTYIKIPMKGQVESLNAAVAASLLMYEAARQRKC